MPALHYMGYALGLRNVRVTNLTTLLCTGVIVVKKSRHPEMSTIFD